MRLTEEEQAMRAGADGPVRRWAIEHQLAVGTFFDAVDLVPVAQAAPGERKVRVPTITDPRGIDFAAYKRLRLTDAMADRERRLTTALEAFGVLMTNTCINYQTILPPVRGAHLAYGDTGVVIQSNAVHGARSNFEGGPSALAAALTGRTPRYGFHLDRHRRGTRHFELQYQPRDLSDWGALGALVGRRANGYWQVPVVSGLTAAPGSDALKHFGSALASFGSVAMYHLPGITPEAPDLADAFDGPIPAAEAIEAADVAAVYDAYAARGDKVDVVVFSAPQLSLIELQHVAELLDGRRVHEEVALLVATSPEIKSGADRMGLTRRIEASGALVLSGVCFYQGYAREMAEANGWRRLMTNSAKLANIIGGYGYAPTLATTAACIDGAVAGRIL